jgi:hypothetical protein
MPIGPCRRYAPKTLIIISKFDYYELFKNILSLIYGIYVDNRDAKLEEIISHLLLVNINSPGTGALASFTLGADDRHLIQSAASTTVPNTGTCVYNLFKELGINHVIKLICSILADFKIIFFSRSYSKLTEACIALESLLFPLKYAGVFVPILPCFDSFLEFPSAPTPYIIGIHSSYRVNIEEMHQDCLQEVIKVDLDGCSVNIPPNVDSIANFPDYLHDSTLNLLFSILKPELLKADEAFISATSTFNNFRSTSINNLNTNTASTPDITPSPTPVLIQTDDPIWIDKLIRAIFIRLFAQLFAGYRYCLLIIRINPKPVICFHKANFLGHHDLVNNEFMNRLLDSMSFQRFIEERGPPFRNCDIFDEIYASVQSHLRDEIREPELIGIHIQEIAEKLFKYEYPQTNLESYLNTLKVQNNNSNNSYYYQRYNYYHNHHLYGHQHQQQQQQHPYSSHNNHYRSFGFNTTTQNVLYHTPLRSYSKIQLPTTDAFTRIHFQSFPILDSVEINRFLTTGVQIGTQSSTSLTSNNETNGSSSNLNSRNHLSRPYLVPYGPPIETVNKLKYLNPISNNNKNLTANLQGVSVTDIWNISCARKLEVISNCVMHIFENNFKDVKKNLNSTFRALKDPRARLHLCNCLQKYVKKNQVILNNEQFDYICKILNESLQNDSRLDEFGVAYSVLQFASAFYRKLNNGTVDQCIYTKLQTHTVWDNMQFWEMAFYTDVQKSIRPVYLTNEEFDAEQAKENDNVTTKLLNVDKQQEAVNSDSPSKTIGILTLNLNLHSRPAEKTALEICGEQMEKFMFHNDEQKENFIRNEQGIIRSHVLHYISQMVNMKIPLDISKSIYNSGNNGRNNMPQHENMIHTHYPNNNNHHHSRNHSNSVTNGSAIAVFDDIESLQTDNDNSIANAAGASAAADSSSIASEDSGYENGTHGYSYGVGEAGYSVWKFVSKFVDRVCLEGNLNDIQKQALHNNLTEVVSMQISTLESVYLESKRIPPRLKPKMEMLKPDFLYQNEQIIEPTPLRCYLIPDGRDEASGCSGGPVLVPAEGALFLTNYRVIYRGIPTDPLVSDATIIRAFPISALTKEKKLSGQYHTENSNSLLHDGLQLRSCTFQLIRVYFDDEVTNDRIEKFRQVLLKLRYPQTVLDSFCLSTYFNPNGGYYTQTLNNKTKENPSQAFRHFAKNTLRKAGLMPRNNNRKLPMSARTPEMSRKLRSPRSNELTLSNDPAVNAVIISNMATIGATVTPVSVNNGASAAGHIGNDSDEDSLSSKDRGMFFILEEILLILFVFF